MGVGKKIAALGMAALIAKEAGNFIPETPAGIDQEKNVVAQTIKGVSDIAKAGFGLVVPDAMAKECLPQNLVQDNLAQTEADLVQKKLNLEKNESVLNEAKVAKVPQDSPAYKGLRMIIDWNKEDIAALNKKIADFKSCL